MHSVVLVNLHMDCLGLEKLLSGFSHVHSDSRSFLPVCLIADLRMERSVVYVLGKSTGPGPHPQPSRQECQRTSMHTVPCHGRAL